MLEGSYGPSEQGGNKNYASWKVALEIVNAVVVGSGARGGVVAKEFSEAETDFLFSGNEKA